MKYDIKGKKVLKTTSIFKFIGTMYETKDKLLDMYYWLHKNNTSNKIVVIPRINDSIVAIKNFSIPLEKYVLSFPSEYLLYDETIDECVIRIVNEHISVDTEIKKINNISPDLPEYYQSTNTLMNIVDININTNSDDIIIINESNKDTFMNNDEFIIDNMLFFELGNL